MSCQAGCERFFHRASNKFRRNTLCISRSLLRRSGEKDPQPDGKAFFAVAKKITDAKASAYSQFSPKEEVEY